MEVNEGKEFATLGVKKWLIKQLFSLGIKTPTPIQKGCIKQILEGNDCIGAAKTGSGKTFAFALPILQNLAEDPYGIFALVLTPTHELAYQIADQFSILGQPLSLRVCIVTGGSDQLEESLKLAKRPHIVVAMPGRLADHITGCDTFSLKKIKYLVLDEADRLFSESFSDDLETIFSVLPAKRQNLLFSATISDEVRDSKILPLNKEKLVIWKETDSQLTVSTLDQRYAVCPAYARDVYLVQALRKYRETKPSAHVLVFTDTKKECQVISMMLNAIGMDNVCLHGFMRQKERISALAQFRSNLKCTLVATNVAARGLDIPTVDLVVNHKLPLEPREYIHRVGRTARAGRTGLAISLITPYDILRLGEIETHINTKLTEFKIDDDEAVKVFTTVSVTRREQEAQLDNEEFEERKRSYRVKRWIQAGVDPDAMEAGLEEMRRKRIKAAKKAKLAKIKQLQSQIKNATEDRLQPSEDIDVSIKEGLKKVNKTLMKKDDRLFSESFSDDLETIFSVLPAKRQNLLFSATISDEVRDSKILPLNKEKLVIWKETDSQLTVSTLDQRYAVCPAYARDVYLVQALRKYRETKPSAHVLVFTDTKKECQVISMMLNAIGMDNVCLHGFMRQKERISALAQFRSNLKCTLVATNVAARGLDIPTVDLVVNHKLPLEPREYIHRVGRTARAGRTGLAISLITPYDILRLGEIETHINTKLTEFKIDDDEAVKVFTTVSVTRREQEAQLDNEEFEERKRSYRVKRWIQAGVDPDAMEAGLEEMRRKRIKAAKKAKLAKIKQLQSQIKNDTEDIDASIKEGLKKVNKTLMKKDDRFKDVIGKISKIKRKAEKVKTQKDTSVTKKKKKVDK